MTDPPPPTGPPPGWYPDPGTGQGLRWWDGSTWTEHTQVTERSGPWLTAPGEWLRESVRLAMSRAGHYFPLVVIFIIPTTMLNGMVLWYALRDAVLITDPETSTFEFTNPSGNAGIYALAALSTLLMVLASLVVAAVTVRQTQAKLEEQPEPWSASLVAVRSRLARSVGAGVAVAALLVGLYAVLLLAVGAVAPVLLLLTLPLWVVGSALVAVRLSLGPIAAVLTPAGTSALPTSWALTRSRFWALCGRLLLLMLVSVLLTVMASVVAAPFTAIGGGASSSTINSSAEELRFGELLGTNPAVFAISQLFSALGNGAATVLWAVALTLLYRNLGGPVVAIEPDGALSDPGQPADDHHG